MGCKDAREDTDDRLTGLIPPQNTPNNVIARGKAVILSVVCEGAVWLHMCHLRSFSLIAVLWPLGLST